MSATTRRAFLRFLTGGVGIATVGCAHHHAALTCEGAADQIEGPPEFDRKVLRFGPPDRASVVLLHELPGMYHCTLALARRLAAQGMTVYAPLLFGTVGQESVFLGYLQSCWSREFSCGAPQTTSGAVQHVSDICDKVQARSHRPVAVIGMCLTGAFPLALLGRNRNVTGAVLCQPALPFSWTGKPTKIQAKDLGVTPEHEKAARGSGIPFLALRYLDDHISPERRMQVLEDRFAGQVAAIRITNELGHENDHSTLAGAFDPGAFEDTVAYLNVRLGLAPGPIDMRLARLNYQPCRINAQGRWEPQPRSA